jgi:UDP-glucose 4-epimerase
MADVNDVQADPAGAETANARATLAVLEAARRVGVKRVVYGSTIWVYSDVPETAVCEETRLSPPAHLYTATKLAGELYCRSYAELYGIEYTVLRFGIPYGPRARDATVLAAFTRKALEGEALTVAGSGDQTRRFVYVEDLADGVVRALEEPAAANRVYNLAGTETTTILEIAQAVRDLVGDAEIVHTPARAGDFGGKEVSSERALAELGWEPATPFREGARRYVEWRLERGREPEHAHSPEPARPGRRALLRPLATAWLMIPRRLRPALSGLLVSAAFFWSFASDDGLAVIAWAFPSAKPVDAVETKAPDVGLIVDAPSSEAVDVAEALSADHANATIALTSPASNGELDMVRGAGSDVIPRLKPGGPVRWIGTRGQLKKTAHGLGLHGHFYYAAPGHGFTLAQDLLGKTTGATPVTGAVKLKQGGRLGKLERGDLIEISVDGGSDWRPWVASLVAQMRADGLRPTSATSLVRAGPDQH